MRPCDDFYDDIVFYDNLTAKEKQHVDRHIKECQKCHKLWREFREVENGLNTMLNHINAESLNRYTVYLVDPDFPDFDGRQLTEEEIQRIQSHTSSCDLCSKKLSELRREYQEISEYFEESDLPDLALGKLEQHVTPSRESKVSLLQRFKDSFENILDDIEATIFAPVPKLVPIGIGAMAALFTVVWFGPFLRNDNPYFHLTGLETDRITVPTRGITSEDIGKSLDAFKAGDYESTINFLEGSLASELNENMKATGHYLLGISYLEEAKTDILGRFRKVDTKLVEKAISNLQIAKSAGTNSATREECDWYIAKAYLLQGKVNDAKRVLEELTNSQGRRYFDAIALIEKIEGIIRIK